jgi:acyl-CoA synthetase (AMP-forming)/AMP-acid ligase II
VAAGADAVKFAGLVGKVLLPAVLAPIIAGLIALITTYLAYRIHSGDRVLAVAPFFHAVGFSVIANAALHAGAAVVTMPRFEIA